MFVYSLTYVAMTLRTTFNRTTTGKISQTLRCFRTEEASWMKSELTNQEEVSCSFQALSGSKLCVCDSLLIPANKHLKRQFNIGSLLSDL